MTQDAAMRIYQANLDAVTRRYLDADWDRLLDHLGVPARLSLADASIVVETEADLVTLLTDQRAGLLRMGMTDYQRLCTAASFANRERTAIRGTHMTYILRGGSYLMEPYPVTMALEWRAEGGWKAYGLSAATLRNRDYSLILPQTLAAMTGTVHCPAPTEPG